MKRIFFLFCVFVSCSLFADGLRLMNDSSLDLTATVRGNAGKFLGQVTIPAGTTLNWVDGYDVEDYSALRPMNPYTEGYTQSPYTVVWTTEHGEVYSVCRYQPPGSTVAATQCDQIQYLGEIEEEEE